MSDRARGITVKVLDLSDLAQSALIFRRETHPNATKATVYGGEWAVAEKDGKLFAICTEGVGFEVNDDEPMEFEFHAQYSTEDEHRTMFDVVPFAAATVSPAELRDFPVKAEVDLADHVRKFGHRLENNFWIWHDELA